MSFQNSSFITTEDGGRQNMYATEARLQPIENYKSYSIEAEKSNGRWAMIGFLAAISTYSFTGQIIPGVF
mgnify:CR=1 FL=1